MNDRLIRATISGRLNQRSLFPTNLEIRRTAPIFMQGVPPPRSEGPAHQSRAPSCTCMRTAIYKFCSIIIMCSGSIRFWITLSAVIRLISGLLYTPSTQLKSRNWTESSPSVLRPSQGTDRMFTSGQALRTHGTSRALWKYFRSLVRHTQSPTNN